MIGSPKDLVLTPHVRLTHFAVDVLTVTSPEVLCGEELMQLEAGYPLALLNNTLWNMKGAPRPELFHGIMRLQH